MGGDDVFILDLDTVDLSAAGTANHVIDGGRSEFGAGETLRNNGLTDFIGGGTGFGDTLVLQSTADTTLDFSQIDDSYFRGIERIDLTQSTGAITLEGLTYDTIVNITDNKNTLIFRGDGDDTLDFGPNNGSIEDVATKLAALDDISISEADGNTDFDVYQIDGNQGTVTILIEQNLLGNNDFSTVA